MQTNFRVKISRVVASKLVLSTDAILGGIFNPCIAYYLHLLSLTWKEQATS